MCKACVDWTKESDQRVRSADEPSPAFPSFDDLDPGALARYQRLAGAPLAKLRAAAPAWLKAHEAAARMPAPFIPDYRCVLPHFPAPCLDAWQRERALAPFRAVNAGMTPAKYAAVYTAAKNLRP